MLILTRKSEKDLYDCEEGLSEVVINTSDGDIVFRIESIRGKNVKISVDAPEPCSITRGELLATH